MILLDLTIEEHVALSRSLSAVMAALEPCQLQTAFSESVDFAYEFQYSVYLREAAARLSGIMWLPVGEIDDLLAVSIAAKPVVDISFDRDGSLWRVSSRQLDFIQAFVSYHSGSPVAA